MIIKGSTVKISIEPIYFILNIIHSDITIKTMDKNFEVGKIITVDDKETWKIIEISENCSDGLRFDIESTTNKKIILKGCWLWDVD